MNIKRGDIVLVSLNPIKGLEQGGTRPCLVIQNDIGNKASPTTIVAALTSKIAQEYGFNIFLKKGIANLPKDSMILLNQIRTISINDRIISIFGKVPKSKMVDVDNALKTSLGLN